MIQKKVNMLGAFAVGKTSLVARYVSSIFSDTYQTTVGVTIKKRVLKVDSTDATLVIWDQMGEDEFQWMQTVHIRGSAGFMLVLDGTRRATLDVALGIEERVRTEIGVLPFVVVINKTDLKAQWEITDADIDALKARGWPVFLGSAKSGDGVEQAFEMLARRAMSL